MIQVIERFHKIMEIVAENPEAPRALSELAAALEISSPACSNIVRTMTELGYLRSLGPRRGFVMGDTPYFLTRLGPFRKHLVEPAMPIMKKLEAELNEFVVLVTDYNGNRQELIRLEGNAMVRVSADPGLRSLLHSSTGCAMLAHKSDKEIADYWKSHSEDSNVFNVDNLVDLMEKMNHIRELGYCILAPDGKNPEELMNSSVSAGFPVRDNGKSTAAVGIMMPAMRMLNGKREEVIAAGLRTAREIEKKIN